MARDVRDTIDNIIKVVPTTEVNFLAKLTTVKARTSFSAKAQEFNGWADLYNVVYEVCIMKKPFKSWHYEVASVFYGKPLVKVQRAMDNHTQWAYLANKY